MTTTARWTVTVLGALGGAAVIGALAAVVGHGDSTWTAFWAFGAATVAPAAGVLSLVTGLAGRGGPTHPEDTVEEDWARRAFAGAFLDLVIVLGVAVALTAVLDTAAVPPVLVLGLAMADAAVRYVVLSRREA